MQKVWNLFDTKLTNFLRFAPVFRLIGGQNLKKYPTIKSGENFAAAMEINEHLGAAPCISLVVTPWLPGSVLPRRP